jgi:hypothetical protein
MERDSMKFILILLAFMPPIVAVSSAQCVGTSRTHGHLHWSESAKIVAPNRAWQVEVHPILDADENKTPVTLRSCSGPSFWPLFTLQRDAYAYWSSDSKHLLIVNAPFSGTNKLLLFSVDELVLNAQKRVPDALDTAVTEELTRQLGERVHIVFYLPIYASWKGNNLLLAVGGEFSTSNTGPMGSYCYGFLVDSDTSQVKNVLSKRELEAKTGGGCQVSP